MNIIVFGATGGTGRATIDALTSSGHSVTGFARRPSALPPGIAHATGDVMNPADVAAAMPAHDAVVISLGNSQNPFAMMLGARRTTPPDVCATGTSHIIAAMQSHRITRVVIVSAYGIGAKRASLPLGFRLFYATILREHMDDKEHQEKLIKASNLDWTIVQPVGLTNKSATGTWLASTTGEIRSQQISRADTAAFIAATVTSGNYRQASVALSG